MKQIFVLWVTLLIAVVGQAQEETIAKWVSWDDLKRHLVFPFSNTFEASVKQQLEQQTGFRQLYNIRTQEVLNEPAANEQQMAIVASYWAQGQVQFVKAELTYQQAEGMALSSSLQVRVVQVLPLAKLRFKMQAGLIDMKVLLHEPTYNISILYPMSGPAFDFGFSMRSKGRNIFVTPTFDAVLDRTKLMEKRTDPAYYKGKPFVRMIPTGQTWSVFGFHISPWTDHLERGYYGAGCLRLQEHDLYELTRIVKWGGDAKIPVQIRYDLPFKEDHPYPLIRDSYHVVYSAYEKEGREVFKTKLVHGRPPLERLYKYIGYWPQR